MRQFLPMALISGLVTLFTTPLVIYLARKYGLVDDPRKRRHPAHTHRGVIPRAGGAALFLGITAGILVFLPLTKLVAGIMLACLILTIVGLADDKKDLNPYLRLGTNLLAAIIAVAAGAGIPYITNPLSGGILHLDTWRVSFNFLGQHSLLVWADLLAVLWIVWTMNIVGWSAGVDGQMPGFVAISALVIAILSLRYSLVDPSQMYISILAVIIAGAYAGFLPWNFYPQKIMPGYSGKTLAGFFLAILAILSYAKLGTALLVLGVPMVDAGLALLRRVGKGKSPVWADRGHLHHRLLDLGWGKRRIALFYWLISAILGIVALTVNSQHKLFAFLLFVVLATMLILWVNFFTQLSKPLDRDNG